MILRRTVNLRKETRPSNRWLTLATPMKCRTIQHLQDCCVAGVLAFRERGLFSIYQKMLSYRAFKNVLTRRLKCVVFMANVGQGAISD